MTGRYNILEFTRLISAVGLHLTARGYKVFFDRLMGLIEENWPDQMPENLPYELPGWEEAPKESGFD